MSGDGLWRNKRRKAKAQLMDRGRTLPDTKSSPSKRSRFGTFLHNSEEEDTQLRKALRIDRMGTRRQTPSLPKLPWENTT